VALAVDEIASESPDDPAEAAANDLLADKIIGWFEGKSEAGPRALGHRSILADVRSAEKADDWFTDCPMPSPYRLFTAEGRGDKLPAITHVDGSSRIQTVDESCGGVRRILEAFDRETGIPVLMNTSFNGPGEPIVETPAGAVAFLLNSEIDVIYIEGRRLTRT